jgi:hypothetical protein
MQEAHSGRGAANVQAEHSVRGAASPEHAQGRVAIGADDDLLSVAGSDEPQLLAAMLADVPLEERPRIAADGYAHEALRSRREQALRFT